MISVGVGFGVVGGGLLLGEGVCVDVVILVLVSEVDEVWLVVGNVRLEVFEGVWELIFIVDFVVDFVLVFGNDDDDNDEDVWVYLKRQKFYLWIKMFVLVEE